MACPIFITAHKFFPDSEDRKIFVSKRLLCGQMKRGRAGQKHVVAPVLHPADQRQQKPLSQVTGVVNNPVCDPEESFEGAVYS